MVEWKKRCDNNHVGHFFVDYMRKNGNEICQIDAATGQQETCASVLSRSIQLAQCFKNLGLVPGDPIVVGGRNHLDVHIPFYAAMISGQPMAGIDPALKSNELKHLLSLVEPKIAFCDYAMFEEYKNAIEELNLRTRIVTFGGGEAFLATFMDSHRSQQTEDEFKVPAFNTSEVYCWLVSTSGSTGQPKIVALSHPHILEMLEWYKYKEAKNGVRKTALNLSTLHWISGCHNALVMPINHIKVQSSAVITTEDVIDIINKYKPAGTLCTPTALAPILHHEKHCDLTCFDDLKTGGSKVHSELLTSLKARVREDTEIVQGYGLSESGGLVIGSGPDTPDRSVGTLNPKYEAKLIFPETGKEILEPNVTGELFIRGPIMACYYNDPEETRNVFDEDGYLKTGDLFYKDERGFYYFVDRLKMLLKYRNYQQLSASKHLHGGVVFLDSLPTTMSGKVARLKVKEFAVAAQME